MELVDSLRQLAENALGLYDNIEHNEEATKTALVMPFIAALGYNVFDPTEVAPELTSDVGSSKGARVDYAIMKDGEPVILIECKAAGADLEAEAHTWQLAKYFTWAKSARFGILTNGVSYRFYSDLDELNLMDARPFLEFSLLEADESVVGELEKFTRGNFDLDGILSTASDLMYTREIKKAFAEEYREPSDDFVRHFARRVRPSNRSITKQVLAEFRIHTRRAVQEYINDRISSRLKSALTDEATSEANAPDADGGPDAVETVEPDDDSGIVTTEEEIQAYFIVKAILHEVIDVSRVTIRDRLSYCGILLDNNDRKPICRLHFNSSQKRVGLFDGEHKDDRAPIADLNEIYGLAGRLRAAVEKYDAA